MKKTPKKILESARILFNTRGVNNVRLQDIAENTGISPGNLSYHYGTKKDLMSAVLEMLQEATTEMRASNMQSLESEDYLGVIKNYLRFQIMECTLRLERVCCNQNYMMVVFISSQKMSGAS